MRRAACIGVLLVVAALGGAAPAHGAYTIVDKWGPTDPGYLGNLTVGGVAVGPTGTVYVADQNGSKVTILDQNGVAVKKFGSFGFADGHFAGFLSPDGLATDPAGNVYVADPGNCRVQKFDAAGQFLLKWGTCGTSDGQFGNSGIRDLAVGSNGHVYVTDAVDTVVMRVQEFTGAGAFVRTWGSIGSGDGQFRFPLGITADSAGNVYVADSGNDRVQKFDSTGAFLTKWSTAPNSPSDVSAGPGDAIYVATSDAPSPGAVKVYDTSGNQTGALTAADGFTDPGDIGFGPSRVYVTDRITPRAEVEVFDSAGAFITHWGPFGNIGDGQFRGPSDVDQAPNGDLYVVDSGNDRIERFDRDGTFLSKFGSSGTGPGQFTSPAGVAVAPNGELYVVDGQASNGRVQHFDSNGTYLGQWSAPSAGGVAVDPLGQVYVTLGSGNHQVRKFSSTGTPLSTWSPGLLNPRGIAVDDQFKVYVADRGHHQVKVLDQSGTVLATYGDLGGGDGQFTSPQDVAVDASGEIYVADSNNYRVQKLSPDGTFLTKWGSFGVADGQFDRPVGIAVDDRGDALVADFDNNRIQKFRDTAGFPRPKAATPIYATLVPAYSACGSPNRVHAPPLSFDSCAPPVADSPRLTVGTPDANGQPAKSVASLKFIVSPGNPSTPADEADVHFFASITDVRQTSDLADYTGELEARIPLTITDKLNSPYPAGRQAGTTVSFPFSFAIPCAATGDTTVGATCDLHTTAETILPGSVTEGARAIWEAGPVEVRDGGDDSDGDTPADDSPFLRQGVFVP